MIDQVNVIRDTWMSLRQNIYGARSTCEVEQYLYKSALEQAEEMETHHFFNHYSIDGLNIGQRLIK